MARGRNVAGEPSGHLAERAFLTCYYFVSRRPRGYHHPLGAILNCRGGQSAGVGGIALRPRQVGADSHAIRLALESLANTTGFAQAQPNRKRPFGALSRWHKRTNSKRRRWLASIADPNGRIAKLVCFPERLECPSRLRQDLRFRGPSCTLGGYVKSTVER